MNTGVKNVVKRHFWHIFRTSLYGLLSVVTGKDRFIIGNTLNKKKFENMVIYYNANWNVFRYIDKSVKWNILLK